MRILHAISGLDPENGGPTFALIGLAEAQARVGLEVTVALTWQTKRGFEYFQRLEERGVKVVPIGQATGKLSRHPELAATIQRLVGDADVVHIHALWEEIQHLAARCAHDAGKPYIVRPCGMLSPWSFDNGTIINRWGKRIFMAMRVRTNLQRAAALNFTAQAECDLAARLKLAPPAIIEPVGIALSEFAQLPQRNAFRAGWPAIGNRPMLLFLGRLSPQKGLDILIPAFARLAERDRETVLVLAGPDYDNYTGFVKSLVAQYKLNERVVMTGMLHGRQRIEALVDADLFVLSSRHENFGIVVAEAMACGTPVLLSHEVNIWREVVEAGAGGATPLDADAFGSEVERWMADDAGRRLAGEKGRAFAFAHYDWDGIARRWVGHYERLAAGAAQWGAAMTKVTIVTPSFNQAKFLEETLQSILRQREQIHEFFVIDGGSTDGSVEIIRKYANQIDWWVSEKDRGQADAIAKGFARATGDVLGWLNSDDVYFPRALAKVRSAFDEHPDWDALTAYHVRMDADSRILSLHRMPREGPALARWGMHQVNQQTCFFKRAMYEKVGGIDLALHCVLDCALWCRMFDASSVWGHIPEYLAGFRQHAAAKNSSWLAEYAKEDQWMREHYPQYCARTPRHYIGRAAQRLRQIASGRYFSARADERHWRGKTISEVFG